MENGKNVPLNEIGILGSAAKVSRSIFITNHPADQRAGAHDRQTNRKEGGDHRRLDEQAKQIHLLDMTVTVSSNVDGQIREEIKTLKDTVEKNHEAVAPTLEEWKKMKTLGYGIPGADRVRGPDHWRHHCLCQRWGSGGASALVED
ncbi:hypothetical protein ACVIDN_005318 [Rhizobium brockwellii]